MARHKQGWQAILVAMIVIFVSILTRCIDLDWSITLNRDGSGTAKLNFINDSLPTANFKADLERGNDWIQKLYRMRATSDVGREAGREYVLYHVNFEHISDLSDDDLRFSYGKVDDGKSYQLRLTPMLRNPLIPPIGFHLEVKMPGEVIQSNASSVTDDVAVWDGTLNEFSRRGALYAKAEVWFLPPVMLAGLGIALLVIVGGVVWLMRTKRQRAGHQIRTGTIGQATDLRQCPHCQEFVSINVRFCKHCGASLSRGQIVG